MTKIKSDQAKVNGFDVLENLEEQELLQQLTPRYYDVVELKDFTQAIQDHDQGTTIIPKNHTDDQDHRNDQDYINSLNHVVSRFYKYLDRAVDFVKAYTLNISNPCIVGIIADLVDYYATNRGDISDAQKDRYNTNMDTLKALHSNKIKLDHITDGEVIPPQNAPSIETSERYRDRIWGDSNMGDSPSA